MAVNSSSTRVPYLADLIRRVKNKVDQEATAPGTPSFTDQEIVEAANDTQAELVSDLIALDKNFQMYVDTSYSVTSGTRTLTLPTDLTYLRKVVELDGSGNEVLGGEIYSAYWEDLGRSQQQAIFLPQGLSGANQYAGPMLYFTRTPTRSFSVKLVYGFEPLPLLHGVAVDGGATSIQLADYESYQDSVYVNQDVYIFKGTGAGQSKTITAYVGSTRIATVSAWSTVPDDTSQYTSRPNIPNSATEAFIYGMTARLLEKYGAAGFHQAQYEKFIAKFKSRASFTDRQNASGIRDEYQTNFADPYDDGLFLG